MPNPKSKHPKVKCPICGNLYSKMYLRTHQINKHNSPLKRGRKVVQALETPGDVAVRLYHESNNQRRFKQEQNFIILTDNEGSLWIAEKIR